MSNNSVTHLATNQLQPNPFQPRDKVNDDEIDELVQSVKQYGILEPLVIAKTPAGYQIIAGERRWRAARKLNLEQVPVVIRTTTPRGMLEMAIVENVQRVNLSPIERAQAFQQLHRDFDYSEGYIAEKIGKSISFVSNSLKLLKLPDAIKDGLAGKMITEGHARAISGISDPKAMVECYKIILKENASVRRAEELARRFKAELKQQADTRGRSQRLHDPQLDILAEKLEHAFIKPTVVKLSRSSQNTRVVITLKGNPQETQQDLEKILSLTKLRR